MLKLDSSCIGKSSQAQPRQTLAEESRA